MNDGRTKRLANLCSSKIDALLTLNALEPVLDVSLKLRMNGLVGVLISIDLRNKKEAYKSIGDSNARLSNFLQHLPLNASRGITLHRVTRRPQHLTPLVPEHRSRWDIPIHFRKFSFEMGLVGVPNGGDAGS